MGSHGDASPSPTPSPTPSPSTKRPTCARCSKPTKLCLCSRFTSPPLPNSISITVLQHTHEINHPLNSTRVAKLGFQNISVVHVSDVNLHAQLQIHPLGLGFDFNWEVGNSSFQGESLDLDRVDRIRENVKPGISLSDAELDTSSDLCSSCNGGDSGNCIVKEMNKYKVICSQTSLEITLERTAKPNLNWVPKTLIGKSLTSNGFRVKRLHTKKKHNSTEIYDILEYDMIIPPNSVLLFPNEKSVGLGLVDFEVKNLIVLDGTWAKAQRMYHENPWLKLLPHVKLDLNKESLYSEVRQEPRSGCLSTIESIVFALKKFGEDSERLDMILGVFESMILDQRRCKDENFSKSSQT